jgi:hypothetical protein
MTTLQNQCKGLYESLERVNLNAILTSDQKKLYMAVVNQAKIQFPDDQIIASIDSDSEKGVAITTALSALKIIINTESQLPPMTFG